ncbi:MAG: methylmalonyl Co-A mutase-associated GTPase MeaB [Fidelibacterota bacterium]|nr:MAG: methylmalonyl Co-A mutase-associated GTPase MeaB [Candidatus Neomarinimicrobiota bacterium]
MTSTLVEELLGGSLRSLAQTISHVENETLQAPLLLDSLFPHMGHAYRVGVTGPPGAGKSTLVDKITQVYRDSGKRVGIIVVDPSSPFTGGALLGDRLRMSDHYLDEGVFIRSMATRGETGGLAARSQEVGDLLDAAGYDIIIFETVGVGQVELDVVETVDTTLVVLVPESGDDIQLMKAGIIEIGDIFIINKSDREGARQLGHILEQLLALKEEQVEWKTPVCQTSATLGTGIEELMQCLERHHSHLKDTGLHTSKRRDRARQRVHRLVADQVMSDFWNTTRLDIMERGLDTVPPYQLSRSILEES